MATFSRTPRGFEAHLRRARLRQCVPFSRTPRGFEALDELLEEVAGELLSAEPLVGLKLPQVDRREVLMPTFSRTPRGFEAARIRICRSSSSCFQPNPSWV